MMYSLRIETNCFHADALADALLASGAFSASIEDADAGTARETPQFGEPGSVTAPGWKRSNVIALFYENTDMAALVAHCAALVALDCPPAWTIEEVADQNWVALTQSQFNPIKISDNLWIVPSWHLAPDKNAIVLSLDPGMAFGTGSHPTTHLCLAWLERTVCAGKTLLDYGTGSGILAIAAAKLGAVDVMGVDIDAQAVSAAKMNADRNNVSIRFDDLTQKITGQFDIVVANILSNPLKALAPAIVSHVKPDGFLALSGILAEQSEDLIAAYAPYISLTVDDTLDGWVCLSGQKSALNGRS